MTDATRGAHPGSADLQRFADGEADGLEPAIRSHVDSCVVCRDEIERVGRVTAALALSSKPPASLMARVQARRAAVEGTAPRVALRAGSRGRRFFLPVALAAAAVLVMFAPRALREARTDADSVPGAKGVAPDNIIFATVLDQWRQASLDSVAAAARDTPASYVEITFDPNGRSDRARLLGDSIAHYLERAGIRPQNIAARRLTAQESGRTFLPQGAVGIKVHRRSPRAAPP